MIACSWSAELETMVIPCPRPRMIIWSRETGVAITSRVSLLFFHNQAESDASRDSSRFPRRRLSIIYRQPPSGQSRVYRVTQLRTDGVPRQQSMDGHRGPEVLNAVASITNGCSLFFRFHRGSNYFYVAFFSRAFPTVIFVVTTHCLRPFPFVCFFAGDVPFSEYFCTITVLSLYGEKFVRFSLRMVFFYLVTTGWIFYTISSFMSEFNQSIT